MLFITSHRRRSDAQDHTMRFLILSQYFPPEIGGPQTRLAAMSRELVRLGHEVEVVTALPNYPTGRVFPGYRRTLYRHDRWEGISVHRVWSYAAVGRGFRRLWNYFSFALTSSLGLVKARRPDYLFVESPPLFLGVPAFVMSRLWRVPFIFNVSDLWPDSAVQMGIVKSKCLIWAARRLENWIYRKASYGSAVTKGIREALRIKGVPESKLLFLPNGVDTEMFKPAPPDLAFKKSLGLEGKKVVLYQGNLGYAQGLEVLLKAAKLLENDSDIHILFVGDGSQRTDLEKLSLDLALSNATFMKPVAPSELPRFFSIAACGFASLRNLPLFQGARPSKIFPIMSSGKPVVFMGDGEAARLINTAQAGIVLPFGEPGTLAQALRQLADRPGNAEELGKNGRRYVEDHMQWTGLIQTWLAELSESRSRFRTQHEKNSGVETSAQDQTLGIN
jgi:putative colanic acid biosynthesis glycosyltransferase WcaI